MAAISESITNDDLLTTITNVVDDENIPNTLDTVNSLETGVSAISEESVFDELSLKNLAHELATATENERKRRLIDDTKKKAIVVAHSYEDFKNRVACADMKALSSKELKELGNNQTHNRAFGFNTTHQSVDASVQAVFDRSARARGELTQVEKIGKAALKVIKSKSIPTNVSELDRDWKREEDDNARYNLLKNIGLKALKKIFKKVVPFDLLSDITRVLSLNLLFEDVNSTMDDDDDNNNSNNTNKNNKKNSKFVGKTLVAMTKTINFSMYQFALNENDHDIIAKMIEKFTKDSKHGGLKPDVFDQLIGKYTR